MPGGGLNRHLQRDIDSARTHRQKRCAKAIGGSVSRQETLGSG